jgi:hypothetical protein
MSGDLDDIVGGIGVRLCEIGDHNLVNAAPARLIFWLVSIRGAGLARPRSFCIPGFGFKKFPDNGTTGLKRTPQSEHGRSDRAGFRAGKSHDSDSAPSGRSNDGDNGVIQIHP